MKNLKETQYNEKVSHQGKLKMGKQEALSSPLHNLLARNSSLTTDQFLLIREIKMIKLGIFWL